MHYFRSRSCLIPSVKHLKSRFSSLPSFGLFCASTLVFVVISMGLLLILQFPPSRGIEVHLARVVPNSPLADPLVVRIEFAGLGLQPNLQLNSQPVTREGLGTVLKDSLKLRPDWVVYIKADPEVDWQHVVDAIDTGRNAHAKVVLLTMPGEQ